MNAVRVIGWRYPHWWAATLSAAAWCWLTVRWWRSSLQHPHTAFTIVDWMIMVFAMMLPLVIDHIRFTAVRSLWARRQRATVLFVCGYLGTWLLIGVALSAMTLVIGTTHVLDFRWTPAAAFAAASLWQLAPAKRRALAKCHRTMPLAPHGWRANRDCLRYGWITGTRCAVTCGALMLACAFAGHGVLAMLSATAVAGVERYDTRAHQRSTPAALGVIAVVYALPNLIPRFWG